MKSVRNIILSLLAGILLFNAGCNKENEVNNPATYNMLKDYLELSGLDIPQLMKHSTNESFLMEAPADGDVSDFWVMDIRNASDFVSGHIENAHHAGYKDILIAAMAAEDNPILVVDYTGEVASYAVALLRLYGYDNAKALKWGMSGWNESLDVWTANCGDLITESNWTDEIRDAGNYSSPNMSSGATSGDEMLKERIETVFTAGYKGKLPEDVLANPSDYFINCYTTLFDYTGFGHIKGAFHVYPLDLGKLNRIDSRNKVLIYSYSGHLSAFVTAYLNVLGFDAYNLKYGLNGMTKSNPYWAETNSEDHWGFAAEPRNLVLVSGNE